MRAEHIAIAALLIAVPALAQTVPPAQKGVDFTQPVLDADGSKIAVPQQDPKAEPKYLTLGQIAATAVAQNDGKEPASDVVKRGELAIRIAAGKDVVLSAEDVTTIESAMAKYTASAVAIARVIEAIDPAAVARK